MLHTLIGSELLKKIASDAKSTKEKTREKRIVMILHTLIGSEELERDC